MTVAFNSTSGGKNPITTVSPAHQSVQALTRLATGGNAEIFAWGDTHVVKLFRAGLSRSAAELELQHSHMAHASGIPVPQPEEIIEIEGRHGIVFERCNGSTLFECALNRRYPVKRLAELFFELQRAVHGCSGTSLPPITHRLAAKIRHAAGISESVRTSALDRLERLPQGTTLCHGDFHPSNIIMAARGPVIVDWLDAGRGEATMDLVRARLLLEYARPGNVDPQLRTGFLQAYAACCRDAGFADSPLTTQWLLPVAVARLAEPVGDTERRHLMDLVGRIFVSRAQSTAA